MSSLSTGKIAVVTGTSSGIGLSTALLLAQADFRVIATMRDTSKASRLEARAREAGIAIEIRHLDVQDDASVTACVQDIVKAYGRIDLLVNNAGAGYLGSLEYTPMSDLQRTMDTNFFGVWRVTQAVFPLMRAVHSGRIITVTSVGGLVGQPFNDAYCAAKFAVEGFMESLAPVAMRLGIGLSLIEPGPVNTEFVSSVLATRSEPVPELQEVYQPMIEAYMGAAAQNFATIGQTPDDVAKIIVEAATVDKPHFRYTTSEMIRGLVARKYVDPTGDNLVAFFESRLS